MGAEIAGIGSHRADHRRRPRLAGAVHAVLPDRIEFGTLACAAAPTANWFLPHGRVDLLGAAASALEAAGRREMHETADGVIARAPRRPARHRRHDRPLPGFATDLQAPTMALLALRRRKRDHRDDFEQRFRHVDELQDGRRHRRPRPDGPGARRARLQGAAVTGTDVRAAAALVIAGLGAGGETRSTASTISTAAMTA